MKKTWRNVIKSIFAWLLALAMVCGDVDYVRADDVSGNEVVQEAPVGEINAGEIIEEADIDYEKDEAGDDAVVLDADGHTASGVYYGMDWVIDSSGLLTISGNYSEDNWVDAGDGRMVADKSWNDEAENRDAIIRAKVTAKGVKRTGSWFEDCKNLIEIDFSEFDTSQVERMEFMFAGCESLTELDLSGFDTSQVEQMQSMFENCRSLTEIDLSTFKTDKVHWMDHMFQRCLGLRNLDLSSFDTSRVTDMRNMFEYCENLSSLNLSNFNTAQVNSMYCMFSGCKNLCSLDLAGFDTGNVTTMWCMFGDCNNLTSLDLSGFNTSKVKDMHGMFGGCSSLTSLDLSGFNTSKVTDMLGMFGGCSSLTSLDLSGFNTSKVTDMYGMFGRCNSLESLNLSSFNTCNVTDMGSMFIECSSLIKLNLINFDTNRVTNMTQMFYGCKKLTDLDIRSFRVKNYTKKNDMFFDCKSLNTLDISGFDDCTDHMFRNCYVKNIKTIKNLTVDISVPTAYIYDQNWAYVKSPMYDADGNVYTALPKNLSQSIWLSTDPDNVPTDSAYTINKTATAMSWRNAGIIIYDSVTQERVENATIEVDGEIYDSSTTAIIPLDGKRATKTINVSAEGYWDTSDSYALRPGKVKYIPLRPKKSEDEVIIKSVAALYDNQSHKLLNEKINLGYIADIDKTQATLGQMVIYVNALGAVTQYELLQGEDVISSNTDGKFLLDIIQKNGETEYLNWITTDLVNNKPVYVRITGRDGEQVTEKLGINISRSCVSLTDVEQKWTTSFGKKLEFPVPDNIPLIGGGNFKLGFDEDMPVDISIREDGVVRVAFNKPVGYPLESYADDYKNLGQRAFDLRNAAKTWGGRPQKFGSGFFTVTGEVCGYGEGNLSEIYSGQIEIKVGIYAKIEGKGGYKQYFWAGWVPVYLYVEGSVSGKPTLEGSLKISDKGKSFDLTGGSFETQIGVQAGGGVGVELLTALEVSIKGNANYVYKPARNYQKIWITASGKVSQVSLAVFEKVYWESREFEYVVYEEGKDEPSYSSNAQLAGFASKKTTEENRLDSPEMHTQEMSRNYLAYADGYQEFAEPAKLFAVSEQSALTRKVIKSAVLPSADAKLVQAGTKKYLFWLEDIITRSAFNRAALVYSVSEDGVNWSAPQQLISEEENKTLDCGFDLAVSGDKIYVVWQDAEKEYADNAELLTVASGLQIRTAVLDTASGKVSVLPGREAATAGCYLYPQISTGAAADDSHTYVCYALNDLGSKDFSGNNKFTVYFDDYEQDKLGNSKTIALPDNYQPFDMKLGLFGGKLNIICDMDTDGNNATSGDREIVLIDVSNGTIGKLTDNTSADCNPVLTDAGVLYWNSADGIKKVSALGAELTLVTNAINAFTNYSYEVAANGGHDWIFYEGHSAEGDTLSLYGIGERENGTYSNPIEFTTISGNIISKLNGIGDADYIYLTGLEGDFLQDSTLLQDLCLYRIGDMADICVEEVSYDETTAAPGTALPLHIVLANKGNVTVNEATVRVDGKIIATLQSLNLLPGESTELDVDGYVVPETVSKPENHTLSVALADEAVTDNNSGEFTVGYPDFAVETDTRYSGEHTWLDIYVMNTSQFNASGTVFVHRAEEDGEVIFQKAFPDLSSEEVWNSTLSLADYESRDVKYYVEVVSDSDESFVGDNEEFVYIGFGTGIEQEVKPVESVEITGITLAKTVAAMKVGDSQKLTLATQPVAELPASEFLWDSSNARVVSVDETGNIKALMPGTSKVTVYYGDLSATCTVTVVENATDPITIFFDTQQVQRIAPMTGIIPGNQLQLPIPEKVKDKTFIGWYTEAEGGTLVNEDTTFYQTATLYAHWRDGEFELYTLTFDVNGGKALDGKEITRQVFEGDAYGELPTTAREGYSFEGWYTAADGGEKVTAETICKGNVTLYAHWKKNGDNPDIGTDDGDDGILHIAAKGKVDAAAAIKAKLTPDEAARIKKYKSSSSKIATVNKKGIVTGKKDGTATITAYEKVGKKYVELASVEVEVKKPVFKFTKTILQKNEEIDPYDYISNLPKGAKVTWSVPAKKAPIATLNEDSIIVPGGKSGSVKVTCIIGEGAYAAKYTATLKFKLPKLAATTKVKVGKAKKITVSNVPKDAKIEWDWKTASGTLDIQATKKPNAVKVTVPDDTVKEAEVYAIVNGVTYTTKLVMR